MNIESSAIFLGVIVALAVTIWGLFGRIRSPIIGVIATCLGIVAAICAWYAWAETRSTPWTIGYGIVVLAAVVSAVRQFSGKHLTEARRRDFGPPQE